MTRRTNRVPSDTPPDGVNLVFYSRKPVEKSGSLLRSIIEILVPLLDDTQVYFDVVGAAGLWRAPPFLKYKPLGNSGERCTGFTLRQLLDAMTFEQLDVPSDAVFMSTDRAPKSNHRHWLVHISRHHASRHNSAGNVVVVYTNSRFWRSLKAREATDLAHRIAIAVDAHASVFTGFIDVGPDAETCGGLCFTNLAARPVNWHRDVEDYLWTSGGGRERQLVRGVYWGTIVSPAHLAAIGGVEAIRSQYQQFADVDGKDKSLVLPSGNVLFRAWNSIADFFQLEFQELASRTSAASEAAAWLTAQLRRGGAML